MAPKKSTIAVTNQVSVKKTGEAPAAKATKKATATKAAVTKATATKATATKATAAKATAAKNAPKPAKAPASKVSKKTAASKTATKAPAAPKAAAKGKTKKKAAPPVVFPNLKAQPSVYTQDQGTNATAITANESNKSSASSTTVKASDTKKSAAATTAAKANESKKAAPIAKANESKKRKATPDIEEADTDAPKDEASARPIKKARVAPPKKIAKKVIINAAPKQKLNVYVFGEGSSGELGLGSAKNAVDVKRPRLNPHLAAETVGVVQIATGGMHCAALTHDNKIYTWGVNDQGALGRDTKWEGKMKDMDNDNDSDSDAGSDSGMNPRESTPTAIPSESFPEGVVFTQVACGDSTTFALTDDGFVYGWGTFRSNEGILGFTATTHVQTTPALVAGVKKITYLACGDNHVLALNQKGGVFAWGAGQQNQLGRRVVERTRKNGLIPREFGLPKDKIAAVEAGAYHSFATDKKGQVWSWGLNSYGETGVIEGAGEDSAVVYQPTVIKDLLGKDIKEVHGGAHHSIAVTQDGECLVWGRVDGFQMGIKVSDLPKEDLVRDERENARILQKPTKVPGIKAVTATAGSDHCIAIDDAGKAWSWGFGANYQTGLGTDDDVEVATCIDNTAVRGKKLTFAGAGGQYSILAGPAGEDGDVVMNGV